MCMESGSGSKKKETALWRELRTETGRKRYGLALEAGNAIFFWKMPDLYAATEHTFDNIRRYLGDGSRGRMETAWMVQTQYRKLRLPLDFYLPISFGWSEYREVSICEKRYTEAELAAMAEAYQRET